MPDRTRLTNPPLAQDRSLDLVETYQKYGYVMFPQQRRIYEQLALRCKWKSVLEAGCGDGVGGAKIERGAKLYTGTDGNVKNVEFATCLYPWVTFHVWDISEPYYDKERRWEFVVCVETWEHVSDPERTLWHLLSPCLRELWFTSPNGAVKNEHPPSNPFHVAEYTPKEVLGMLAAYNRAAEIRHWQDFSLLEPDTDVTPLVYRVRI